MACYYDEMERRGPEIIDISRICDSDEDALIFFRENGIMDINKTCSRCEKSMGLINKGSGNDEIIFRCSKCRAKCSLRSQSVPLFRSQAAFSLQNIHCFHFFPCKSLCFQN